MFVRQISVFIENKKGRLAALTKHLGEKGIDLIALSIADTTNFGIMRCIVSRTDDALKAIREAGFTAQTTEVLAVEVPDKPGGLAHVLELLADADISVEYLYSFVRTPADRALILFRVDDTDKAAKIFEANGVKTLSQEDIGAL